MGRKSKTGKSRKDKFYHLAKETGYRARSAFKLIQLNRKFEFLQKSRVVIDLCAAPGGWLQVVAENTPVSSLIVGVDLVPIKPIKNCVTLQEDITTDKCRQALKKELQTWKADAVIHDGAPNVGQNWLLDAFSQNQLTLQSLKLATEFLRKGGWFVTKIFRSKDYYSLMWVFQQLFKHVHATKPQASRNESAEIFVVCEKFLAPDKIDPKFMDPKYVFKEVEDEPTQSINLIHPEKKRRQREGYAEGDYTLFHTLKASEFISSDNYLNLLAICNQVTIDTDAIANHKETTAEIKECLKDIKVLGKADIRSLINWRKKLKKDIQKDIKAQAKKSKDLEAKDEDSGSDDDDKDEETKLLESVADMEEDERKALKRKLKKIRRQKIKLQHKMDMKMVIPGDKYEFSDDIGLFNLGRIKNKKQLDTVDIGDTTEADQMALEEEEDDEEEEQLFGKVFRKRQSYDRDDKDYLDDEISLEGSWDEEPEFREDSEEEMEFEGDGEDNPLVMSLEDKSSKLNRKSMSWFSKDSFAGLEDNDEGDENSEDDISDEDERLNGKELTEEKKLNSDDVTKPEKRKQKSDKTVNNNKDTSKYKNSDQIVDDSDDDSSDDDDDDDDSDSDYDINDVYKSKKDSKRNSKTGKSTASSAKDGFEVVPASTGLPKLDAVGLAIGAQLVQSRKRRREIIEDSYHRYMYNDQNLPDWFVKDEAKHTKRQLPVTKGDIEEYKLKQKAIDARPIKKIAEAKARKKKKEVRRLERARKKAEVISDTADISDRDKWQQIKQVYKKAGLLSQKKKEVAYVVAKKGIGKRVRRPNGIQGPFRVVDPRMKKDNRAAKRQAKEKGKKGKSKRGKAATKGGQQ